MRTKFKTHISDALKYSFLETPLDVTLEETAFLTEDEKATYLEQRTLAGIGFIKGRSLCLN